MAIERKKNGKDPSLRGSSPRALKQGILIGVLLLVLVGVLLSGPAPVTSATVETPPLGIIATPISATSPTTPADETVQAFSVIHPLPSMALDDIVMHDPLSSPGSDPELEAAATAPEEPQVYAVYGQGSDAVALIGGSIVRVGEVLPDGRRVVRVTPAGVELDR